MVGAIRKLVQRMISQWLGWCSIQVGAVHKLVQYTSWCSIQVGAVYKLVQYVCEMSSRVVGAVCELMNSRSVGAIAKFVQYVSWCRS